MGTKPPGTKSHYLGTTTEDQALTGSVPKGLFEPGSYTTTLGATVTVAKSGSYTYDPRGSTTLQAQTDGQKLTDSFVYTVNKQIYTATIDVTGINDAPRGTTHTYSGTQDHRITVTATNGLLKNVVDAENDALTAVPTGDYVQTDKGNWYLVNADGSFEFWPGYDWFGTDTFKYTVSDGKATTQLEASITLPDVGGHWAPDYGYTSSTGVPATGYMFFDFRADGSSGGAGRDTRLTEDYINTILPGTDLWFDVTADWVATGTAVGESEVVVLDGFNFANIQTIDPRDYTYSPTATFQPGDVILLHNEQNLYYGFHFGDLVQNGSDTYWKLMSYEVMPFIL